MCLLSNKVLVHVYLNCVLSGTVEGDEVSGF